MSQGPQLSEGIKAEVPAPNKLHSHSTELIDGLMLSMLEFMADKTLEGANDLVAIFSSKGLTNFLPPEGWLQSVCQRSHRRIGPVRL